MSSQFYSFFVLILLAYSAKCSSQKERDDDVIRVYTVASSETDGYKRYLQSAEQYDIHPKALGFGEKWRGGDDIKQKPGGGWKVNLLRQAIVDDFAESDNDQILLFTDGYDVMFLSDLSAIKEAFLLSGHRILFGAEEYCWPDKSLADKYPDVSATHKRYLNSGMFIGHVSDVKKLLNRRPIKDTDDDQLFYTEAFVDEAFRKEVKMGLDTGMEIFQNLNGAINEVELTKDNDQYKLLNVMTRTKPMLVHGNGPSKIALNHLGNYLAGAWSDDTGCQNCKVAQISLDAVDSDHMPVVFVSVFVEVPTPFLEEQLEKVAALEYPKSKMHLFIHNNAKYHSDTVKAFIEKYGKEYATFKQITAEDGMSEWNARDLSLDRCISTDAEYYFSVDSISHIDNPFTLKLLIEQNRNVVAPLLVRPGKAWSNFWGALTTDGFYARSNDYMDIVHNVKKGLWNVPYIAHTYLINAKLLRQYDRSKLSYSHGNLDTDMSFCANLRNLDVFLYLSNRVEFGHLVDAENFDVTIVEPEMYEIFNNPLEWEKRFVHPDFKDNFNPDKTNDQPCPDVYRFPIVTRRFCNSLVHMMEAFGKWSDGSNSDTRLEGGYEAVPTRDIHMNQVGWEGHWLHFMQKYVRPLQEHVFTGYFHDPPKSFMNFVVRYRPDEQPTLRPHHDSSTYTINIALNQRDVDFTGGGCRFVRYDCEIVDTLPGWVLMHPGRLTHYHEGLRTTNGTRYIMVAFIDP